MDTHDSIGDLEAHTAPDTSGEPIQAVLVHLDGRENAIEPRDLWPIEDALMEVIEREGLGEFDGNEVGPEDAILFMYGPDAERLFAAIETTLRANPICKGARAVIRRGEPGAPEREVLL